jgi:hypothetical protein
MGESCRKNLFRFIVSISQPLKAPAFSVILAKPAKLMQHVKRAIHAGTAGAVSS